MGQLDGKVAIITGGARGMGKSHVKRFVDEGAKVVFGDVLEEEGTKLAAELGDAVRFLRMDVTRPEDWQAAVDLAVRDFGRLDVLVNNAGIIRHKDAEDMTVEDFRLVLEVNLVGQWLGVKTVTAAMKEAGGGSIINVSSIEGMRGAVMVHPYVASKWAVRGLTKSAALELGSSQIRVNSIHPGFIRTPMTKHFPDNMLTIPLGRPGQSDEVSTFVVFLASDESRYATGAEFVIDGGLVNDVPHRI
jgi:3alpha(or 20beta)-hydroxysteroid dehydrogenase